MGNLQCQGPGSSNSLNYPDQPLLGSPPTLPTAQEHHLSSAGAIAFFQSSAVGVQFFIAADLSMLAVFLAVLSLCTCLATVGLRLTSATLAGHDPGLTSWFDIRPVLSPWACLVIWTCSHLCGCPTALLRRSDSYCWPGDPRPSRSSQLLLCLDG